MRKLLDVLSRLVDQGNTVIVIEHNLDVVKSADWVIDLGPEGGERGGSIVAVGTPEEVARVAASYTGEVLAPLVGVTRPKPGAGRRPKGKTAVKTKNAANSNNSVAAKKSRAKRVATAAR